MNGLFLVVLFCSSIMYGSNKPQPRPIREWAGLRGIPYVISRPGTPENKTQTPKPPKQ